MITVANTLTNERFNAVLELEFLCNGRDYADPQRMPQDVRKSRTDALTAALLGLTDDELRDYAAYRRLAA